MKKLFSLYAFVVTTLFASTLAFGQLMLTGAGKGPQAATYVGPGNIVSGATAWYGLRAYSAADRGNPLINVCNVSDVVCADLSSDATTGALVISTIGGSSCSVVTCTIKTMYDRSGNGNDVTQATIAARPTLVVSCVNSLPCATFVKTSSTYLSGAIAALSQPYTYSTVAIRTAAFTTIGVVLNIRSTTGANIYFHSTANTFATFAGSAEITQSATDNAWHAIQAVLNGASSVLSVDNSEATGSPGTQAGNTTFRIGVDIPTNPANHFTGNFVEGGIWNSAFSAGNRTAMCHNQYTYWGTSTSC